MFNEISKNEMINPYYSNLILTIRGVLTHYFVQFMILGLQIDILMLFWTKFPRLHTDESFFFLNLNQ